ncbi:NADPH-dependent F420 reductase [Paracoccus sp. S-4012]|uniref:NADPH-dependent F420 reductase n=1 Tax=Paracoccus sp. S-4012 TaxID=2665648 RepID=UPI0012B10E42|nr:NADPH-dependent F420 reductase [Paracoccus sp. S-4012]MRX48905.1 NADPH-dependent F420 reductase [Paracoccus sp. S-4012]
MTEKPTIAIIGGTGAEGGGIALRLANAGYRVVIGGRDAAKAEAAAAGINAEIAKDNATGATSAEAAARADVILLTVPYAAQRDTALALREQLQGKVLIDATVPLMPPKVARVQLPEGDSAVANLQAELGEGVRVVAAFQNVSAHHLRDLSHEVECDVLVCADDAEAAGVAVGLAEAMGLRAYHAGPVANAAAVEALTSLLISINRRYKSPGSGIRITGV